MMGKDGFESQLVAAAKGGDRDAFGELIKPHLDMVLRTAHRITRNREDAEDAAQECFTNAFVHLKRFNERSRFSTWLIRIVINAALMKLRKSRALLEVSIDNWTSPDEARTRSELIDVAPSPEEWCFERELRRALREDIVALRPKLREIVEVHELKHGSLHKTAEILGISTAAVKARLSRARSVLRRAAHIRLVAARRIETRPISRSAKWQQI
jgi:RNA polymerase sigma-70 factor (ECF subfamily)